MRPSRLFMGALALGLSLAPMLDLHLSTDIDPDPYKPKRRSKGEKARNKKARYGK